jgi:hypothetical protein
MDDAGIERILTDCERALETERKPDLTARGFWKAVAAVKRRRDLVDRYADRIARIDREAFERVVPIRAPLGVGLALDLGGLVIDIALIALASYRPEPGTAVPIWATSPWRELVFLAGLVGLLVATHTLTHWIVGTLAGIRFTHWFMRPPLRPQPGFKVDYASYLRTPAAVRAWMHASGAIMTKILPFALYPLALNAGLEPWAIWTVLAIGVLQLVTDAIWSVRASDWKKFRREMRFAG